ncbi:hypothetical protein [Prescottella subtropica]|uniref:hypothetical protein n=1 Tax=Prescottella subtropica TaxID=2545757 RepID=UPI0010F99561|nr:hypothetical protein [Prescottella subtropica]
MGAHSFDETIYTDANAEDAYRELVEQAVHEHGHDGYNGTISTTSGVSVVRTASLRLKDAQKLGDGRLEMLSKWGNCEAIPLVKEVAATYESDGSVIVEVDVSAAVFGDADALRKVIAKQISRPAHDVESWRPTGHSSMTVTKRVQAAATKGKTETRYFVVEAGVDRLPQWDRGFPTQAAARAAFENVGVNASWRPSIDVEVIAITRRVGGQPLVAGTVAAKQVAGRLTVQLRRKVRDGSVGTERAGWYFYGWAAS